MKKLLLLVAAVAMSATLVACQPAKPKSDSAASTDQSAATAPATSDQSQAAPATTPADPTQPAASTTPAAPAQPAS